MRTFRQYVAFRENDENWWDQPSDGTAELAKFYDLVMAITRRQIDPFKNVNAHHQLVDALVALGKGMEAHQLDALMPTPQEIRVWQGIADKPVWPPWSSSVNMGNHSDLMEKQRRYHQLLDEIFDDLAEGGTFDQFESGS